MIPIRPLEREDGMTQRDGCGECFAQRSPAPNAGCEFSHDLAQLSPLALEVCILFPLQLVHVVFPVAITLLADA